MPESIELYPDLGHSSLEQAIERVRAFAHAHTDMEPSLLCLRDRRGQRRWVVSVKMRTDLIRPPDEDEPETPSHP